MIPVWGQLSPMSQAAELLLRFDSECIGRLGAEKRGQKEQEFLSRLSRVSTLTS